VVFNTFSLLNNSSAVRAVVAIMVGLGPIGRPPYLVERRPGYVEYQLPVSVKLVVDYHGLVPLLRSEREEWELPGGKLEVGEAPEQSVRREVAEEFGLTIAGVEIIDSWVYEITPVRHVFIVSYGTSYTGDEQLARRSGVTPRSDLDLPAPHPADPTRQVVVHRQQPGTVRLAHDRSSAVSATARTAFSRARTSSLIRSSPPACRSATSASPG
jgi:8-oxo-dGTP pyrophosphatase MutT (NUDIX family)